MVTAPHALQGLRNHRPAAHRGQGGPPGAAAGSRCGAGDRAPGPDAPDLTALLGDLSDAISVVTVVDRSLAAQELPGAGDEEVTLRHALTLLRTVYDQLDRAIPH